MEHRIRFFELWINKNEKILFLEKNAEKCLKFILLLFLNIFLVSIS